MRTYRRKQIEHVKYIMTLPDYIIEVLAHPNWKRIKKEWAEYDKTYKLYTTAAPKLLDADNAIGILKNNYYDFQVLQQTPKFRVSSIEVAE